MKKAKEIVSGPSVNDIDIQREKKHLGGYGQGGKLPRKRKHRHRSHV